MKKKTTLALIVLLSFSINLLFAQSNPYLIGSTNQSFIPTEKTAKDLLPPANPNQYFDGKYFKLIQFYKIPSTDQQRDMQLKGMQLVDYLPGRAYFAVIEKDFDFAPFQSGIRALLDLDQGFKLESEIFHKGIPLHAFEENKTYLNLIVSYYDGLEVAEVLNAFRELGEIREHLTYARQIHLQIKAEKFNQIVLAPFVQFVGVPDVDPELEAVYWQGNGRGNFLSSGHNGLNFNGDGVTICVAESGTIDFQNLNYKGRSTELSSGNNGGHKVGVASRQAGGGNTRPTDRGVAWGSGLVSASGTSYDTYFNNNNVRFTNHSYGYGVGGGYNSGARSRDLFVTNYPEGSVLYSAGNRGSSTGYAPYSFSGWGNITGATKQGKNYFACASVDRHDAPRSFSSLGPAYDGRIFPQIAIEGAGGTSHAAPKTTGSMAVLSEVYSSYNGTEAPSSLLKAVLLNTADDIHNAGPDFKTGYGRVNLRRAHRLIEANQIITASISNGENNQHVITIPANMGQLKVLVYWRDVAASVNANPGLVNDLDIVLTDPVAVDFLPWVLNHTPDPTLLNNPATRGVDHLNNMEQVSIANPAAGAYSLNVNGFNIPTGPQEYFVVYEFVPRELQITYPINNDRMTPGTSEVIYWDSYTGSNSNFILEYQLDGGAWNPIATVDANLRSHTWTPPALTGVKAIKVRVTQDQISSESANGFVGNKPGGIHVDWNCGSTIKLDWSDVNGATDYAVYQLGAKYMEPVTSNISFDGSSATLSTIDVNETQLFAVAAVENGKEALRSDGFFYFPDPAENFTVTTSSTTASCIPGADGTATVTPNLSSTYTYAWSNGGSTSTISGLNPGTYTVTVTNLGNCTNTKSITVAPVNAGASCDDGNAATANDIFDGNCNCVGTPIDIGCGVGINYVNIATGKPTSQITTSMGGVSSRAVDGNTDGDFANNSVTLTDNTSNFHWWEVDLGNEEYINALNLWERTDAATDLLKNFYVFVSSTPFTTNDFTILSLDPNIWNSFSTASPDPDMTISVDVPGRYIRVQMSTNDLLSLAEVEVMVCPPSPLPVELTHFSVKKYTKSSAQLKWLTSSELNNRGFHIERSKDAITWNRIAYVAAKANPGLQNKYDLIDQEVNKGWNYYRLAQEDLDGTITHSTIQIVFFDQMELAIFPNPTSDQVNIVLGNWKKVKRTSFEVYNALGQLIHRQAIDSDRTVFDLTDYPAGTYSVRVDVGGEWSYQLIVKE